MLGKLDEAYEFCARAIAANPLYAEAHNNRGVLYRDEGRIEEAIAAYTDCLAIDPTSRNAGQNRLLALNSVCRPQVSDEETALAVWQAHRSWGEAFAAQYASERFVTWPNPKTIDRPLRIGYLSADFFTHSVSYFIEAPLAHADKTQTFVACYANVARRDKKTALLQSYAHLWRDVHDKSAKEVAEQVRADGIDILVELTGHTGGNRLDVMALKPAPVQVSWIGYPNTTGLPSDIIDVRFTDEVVDPLDTTQQYSEQLVRLRSSSCFLCYTPPQDAPPVSATPALSRGFVTFGSFNNLAKVNDRVLGAWCAILKAVPTARMLLKCKPFASASVVAKTVQRFADAGVDASRVDCIPLLASTQEHLSAYAQVDVCLDTFPYAGTTTTCEALYSGVPVVSLARTKPNCHAHNVGKSLLTRIEGAQGLIAHSEAEYIAIATNLAANVPQLQQLRSSLRPAMLRSPLCDGPSFVAGLTKVYQQLWRAYCSKPT
jgi:predicted O-linked N-acetylglucosamine transferase (SPINDLY family)